MAKKRAGETTPLSFLSGFVQSREIGRVIAQIDELTEKGSTSSWLMRWTQRTASGRDLSLSGAPRDSGCNSIQKSCCSQWGRRGVWRWARKLVYLRSSSTPQTKDQHQEGTYVISAALAAACTPAVWVAKFTVAKDLNVGPGETRELLCPRDVRLCPASTPSMA